MPRPTIVARYLKHPAADAASSYVKDGAPLGADVAMIVGSNLNHMREQSHRHLLDDVFPGDVSATNDWAAIDEPQIPVEQRTTNPKLIAWSRTTARVYGPFVAVQDRIDTAEPRDAVRKVNYRVRCYGDGTRNHLVFVAITESRRPPSDGYLAFATIPSSNPMSATTTDYSGTLTIPRLPSAKTVQTGTSGSDTGAGALVIPTYYVWVGWYHTGTGTLGVVGADAWESD